MKITTAVDLDTGRLTAGYPQTVGERIGAAVGDALWALVAQPPGDPT